MNQNEETSDEVQLQESDDVKNNEPGFVFEIKVLVCFYAVWAFILANIGVKSKDYSQLFDVPTVFGFPQDFVDALTSLGFNLIFFWLPSICAVTGLLFGLRAVLPEHLKRYLCWKLPAGYEFAEKCKSAWPAVLTVLVSFASAAVLFYALTHIRVDRPHRRPVISWAGPAADYIDWVFVLGWTFAYLTIYIGGFTDSYFTSRWNWLVKVAGGLIGLIIAAAFIITCAVLED